MEFDTHYYSSKVQSTLFWLFNLSGLYFIIGSFYVAFSPWFNGIFGNVLAFLFYFVWGLFPIFFANMFPEITTDENGLLVRFFLWRLRVKWEDLIEVKEFSFARLLSGTSQYVIKTKSLTPFHRFYGLYALSFSPSFLIRSNIIDFSLLLKRIQQRKFNIDHIM